MVSYPVSVNVTKAWVATDITHYANRQDVIDYLEVLYPTQLDKARKKYIQNYDIDTLSNGNHRVWAIRKLRQDEIDLLEDVNNSADNRYNDD